MRIETVPISKLKPSAYNPRKNLTPGDPEYESLKKSIETFGCVEPIIYNRRSGNVVGGHQRLKILKGRGAKQVTVSVVDLDPIKEKALNVALNRIQGEWDFPKLKDLLVELDTGDFNLGITGFSETELQSLIDHEGTPGLTDEDEVPPTPKKAISNSGDLWILGDHRLLCGDATKEADLAKLMDGHKADLVITDPPYNVNYLSGKQGGIKNDNLEPEQFQKMLALAFTAIDRNLAPGAVQYYFSGWSSLPDFLNALRKVQFNLSAVIVWDKGTPGMGWQDYRYQYELLVMGHKMMHHQYEAIVYGFKKNKTHKFKAGRDETDIWYCRRALTKDYEHPTQKPVEVIQRAVMNSSAMGQVVLDPFAGSGSTIIACERMGRKCFAMELDPKFCDVARERWAKFTGKKASLARAGKKLKVANV
ncbi:MAG TPA: site-specific DNA-methyltransferase [Nitrospiria bacterium]|nr:site-specific DNA-methyltransferase [Nitrospiria bacterium]